MILTKRDIKEINLDRIIDEKISSGRLNEILFIVPTNRKIRYLKRDLINASPSKVAVNLHLETLGTYSQKLLIGSEAHGLMVSEETLVILLKQSFRETKLNYFSNYHGEIPLGTLDRVKNVISEYKRHGITPKILIAEAENLTGIERIKAEDIAGIYRKYQRKFTELDVKEIGDIYYNLIQLNQESFASHFKELFPDVNIIVVNGFDEFTLPEIEIINKSAQIQESHLYLSFDYFQYNPAIFSHLDRCYNKLEETGFKIVNDLSEMVQSKFIGEVKQNLFSIRKTKQSKYYSRQITEIIAYNREQEIELIAKEIKKIIIEKKVSPDQICVAFHLIKPYSPIIRDQFSSFSIPFNLTDRLSLNTSPVVISIINLLEIIENDFYYKNIFRALNNRIIESIDVDLNNLLLAAIELKVISGIVNWKNRLNDALEEQSYVNGSDDEFKRYNVNYKKAIEDIENIYSLLNPFTKGMTTKQFYKNICQLIYKLNIHINVLKGIDGSVEKDVKALNVFLKSLKELTDLFEIEFGENKQLPLKFYLSQIKTMVSFSRYNIKEKSGYGVQVTTINEIRGLHFDYLFMAGLTDGDFPTRYAPEIFFSGSFAKEEARHQTEERYHFYQGLCSWGKELYLTYSQTDERKELVQSNFLKEFKRSFKIASKTKTDYDDRIFSRFELLKYIGKSFDENICNKELPGEVEVNLEEINKAVLTNNIRIKEPFAESEFTGALKNKLTDETRIGLSKIREKQFSITQLESYAKCPFQYFAERILRLNTIEEPTEELEAFELGSLLHNILYEFYKLLKEKRIILQGADNQNFSQAEKLLFETAGKKIEELRLSSSLTFYEKEKILGIEGNKKNSILYKFLEMEHENEEGFIPEFFELIFGKNEKSFGDKSFSEEEFVIGNINFRGKIDRVDINEKDKMIKVVDYKLSGKEPTQKDILTGLSLQLPLYLFVAKELINAQLSKNYESYGAEIYSLKFDKKDFGPNYVKTRSKRSMSKDEMITMAEEMIRICIESIHKYVGDITSGKFNLSELKDRENKVCKYCNFRSVCRIQEVT